MNSISAFSFLNFCFYPRETAVIEFQFSKFQLSALFLKSGPETEELDVVNHILGR